jgi:hypothetical protein
VAGLPAEAPLAVARPAVPLEAAPPVADRPDENPTEEELMYARMNTARWAPETYDRAMKLTEETIIPAYQNHPGFKGYLLLTDGEKGVAVTLWDSEENRQSSESIAQDMIGELRGILAEPPVTENFNVDFDVR